MKPETGNQKPQTFIIIWLLICTICLASWSTRLPANLIAENEFNNQANRVPCPRLRGHANSERCQTQTLKGNASLTQPERCLKPDKILADPSRHDELKERLRCCQTNANIEKRYRDESIAHFLKNADAQTAHDLLAEVCKYIPLKFHRKTDQKLLLRNALCQLQIAAQNPLVLQQLQGAMPTLAWACEHQKTPVSQFVQKQVDTLQQRIREKDRPSLSYLSEITKDTLTGRENENQNHTSLNAWILTELAYALAEGLDEYSYLLTPCQYQSLYEHLGGYYVGVGIDLIFQGAYPTIFDVVPNSPADQAGIIPGDVLTRIADVSVKDKSDDFIAKLLTGADKTPVTVCVRRDSLEKHFSLTRALVEAPTVRYVKILDRPNRIGYLRIASFDHDTALELRRAVNSLKRRGANKLVLDLRCNGGGIMASAIDAARLFLERGTIVTVQSAQQSRRYVVEKNGTAVFNLPLVILVDNTTASASEIFAAALQDHQRAALVGQNTLGKAVVQTIFPLANAPTALCVTTASYLPPSRKSFQSIGITPDFRIDYPNPTTQNEQPGTKNQEPAFSMADFLSEQDPSLKTALDILNSKPTKLAKK
jgi:carboxyl-terminal processing protease